MRQPPGGDPPFRRPDGAPRGRLVYSTRTFAPEEDEEAVREFLSAHPDFVAEAVDAPHFTPSGEGMYRMWPHKLMGEGHFAAVLRRRGEEPADHAPSRGEKLPEEWTAFTRDLGISLPEGKALLFGQSLYWVPECFPEIRGLRVLRPGLELGIPKKGRFEPAHALALWLRDCRRTLELNPEGPEMAAWLHGDVVPSGQKGWCLVKADKYAVGWGKGDGNVLKNHYPKGLRR